MVFFLFSQELLDKKDVRSGAKVADEKSPDKNATPAANTTVSSSLSERISHLEQNTASPMILRRKPLSLKAVWR